MRHSLAAASAVLLAAPQLFLPASAIELKGTCDGPDRCFVKVEGDKITTSSGREIKTDNIIGWSFVNTVNRGGILINARNEDYRILIKYFDSSGKRQLTQVGFFNFKTAQAMVSAIELSSGLAPNHDQAGATTKCTAIGKDSGSGTASGAGFIADTAGALKGAGTGAVIGGILGSAVAPGVGTGLGAGLGAVAGQAIESTSGDFNLKKNVQSAVRMSPGKSSSFFDGSFEKSEACIDQPTAATVFVTGPLPTKSSK